MVALGVCEDLPIITQDLQALWETDPTGVVRVLLENEVEQGRVYWECAQKHKSLVMWIEEYNTSLSLSARPGED